MNSDDISPRWRLRLDQGIGQPRGSNAVNNGHAPISALAQWERRKHTCARKCHRKRMEVVSVTREETEAVGEGIEVLTTHNTPAGCIRGEDVTTGAYSHSAGPADNEVKRGAPYRRRVRRN